MGVWILIYVGRTLLSDAFEVDFRDASLVCAQACIGGYENSGARGKGKMKIKVKKSVKVKIKAQNQRRRTGVSDPHEQVLLTYRGSNLTSIGSWVSCAAGAHFHL